MTPRTAAAPGPRRLAAASALALAVSWPAVGAANRTGGGGGGGGGMLDAARSEVQGGSSSSSSSGSGSSSSYSSSYPSSGYGDSSSYAAPSAASAPSGAVSTAATSLRNEPWYFRRHPYSGGRPGHLAYASDPAPTPGARPELRAISLQLALEMGYVPAGVLLPGARVRMETRFLIGLEAGWTHFIEPRRSPDGTSTVDQFGIGDVSALVHARWNRGTLWSGFGLRVLADVNRPRTSGGASGAALGWSGSLGARLFPAPPSVPVVLDARLDFGSLGHASVLRARGTLGVVLRGFEPYAGYDYFSIGAVRFHGPLAGLRAWL